MASGAGHDAAILSGTGVPTLMLFVRNQNGSHNPDEAMEMADFAVVTRLLAQGIALVS
jgi:beta-ureidopropionase / N-carbamoyl-L-amino-acid hydrolase